MASSLSRWLGESEGTICGRTKSMKWTNRGRGSLWRNIVMSRSTTAAGLGRPLKVISEIKASRMSSHVDRAPRPLPR